MRRELKIDITTERAKKPDFIVEKGTRGGIVFKALQDPIDLYIHKGLITEAQYEAGRRFFMAWHYGAVKSRYVLSRYGERLDGNFEQFCADSAYAEYRSACEAINKKALAMVQEVICFGNYLCNIKIGTKNSKMSILKSGLDDLVSHYKL